VCGSSDHAPSAGASITTQPWTAGARKSHQQQLDRQHRGGSLGVTYLHTALGLDTERALVERLATLWGVLPEVLQQRVQALGRLLQPAGRDAPAHALWVRISWLLRSIAHCAQLQQRCTRTPDLLQPGQRRQGACIDVARFTAFEAAVALLSLKQL
jgi:hypothetical protein